MTLLVPYRDRYEQLTVFLSFMDWCFPELEIFIVEQADNKPFNRGKLLNVGFLETPTLYNHGWFVAHDVDMLPEEIDYENTGWVIQLAKSDIQQINYLGGVTMFKRSKFYEVGGYHNDFWHRAEDNEMMFNLKRHSVPVVNRFGRFMNLPHERPKIEFDPILWQKAQLPRTKDMLKTCEYKLISKELKDGYTHLKVEL